jgi:signal transduction histidine kinase
MRRPTPLEAAIPVGAAAGVGVHALLAGVGWLEWLFETVLLIAFLLALRVAGQAYLDARRERDRAGELERTSTADVARRAVEAERVRLSREIESRVRDLLGSVADRAQQALRAADPTSDVRAIQAEATEATSELRRQLGLLRPEPDQAIVTNPTRSKPRLTVLDVLLPALAAAVALTEIAIFAPMEGRTVSPASVLLTVLTAMTLVGRRAAPTPAALGCAALMLLGAASGDDVQDGFWAVLTTGALAWVLAALGNLRSWLTLVVLVSAVSVSRVVNEPDNVAISAVVLGVAAAAGATVGRSRRLRVLAETAAEQRRQEILTATEEAVRAERHQVARELHDLVSHAVSVIAVQAGAAELQWPVDRAAALRAIGIVHSTAVQAVAELDRMPLAQTPIQHTMGDLAALVDRTKAAGQRVRLSSQGEPESEMMPTVYRIVQESLTNALRYAPGGVVDVKVEVGADRTVVEVTSLGAVPMEGGRHGYGLIGLAERVAQQNGSLDAGPRNDREAFVVRAVLPTRRAVPVR